MSIFAKKISKEEIDAIYKQIKTISDHLMRLEDSYFGSLFKDESEDNKSFRLLNAEVHALYAMNDEWLKSRTSTRTIVGRTADLKEKLAENLNYPYRFVCELYDAVKDRVREYQKNYSADEVAMAYATSFFDTTIGIAMEKKGISDEEVGNDHIAMVCVLMAGVFAKERK